eukprot:3996397-Heterocapsa_arctica.AAC.1
MGELAIGFQFDKKVMTVGGKESPTCYTHSGHPKLDLLDYGDDDPAGVWETQRSKHYVQRRLNPAYQADEAGDEDDFVSDAVSEQP